MKSRQRILCLDIGKRKVGIAISDAGAQLARDLKKIPFSQLMTELEKLILEYPGLCEIVIGLPLNMNGTEGKQAEEVRQVGAEINAKFNLKIHWQDERLSSWEARQNLIELGYKPNQIEELEDQMAAKGILQAFLDRQSH
ncbi:MAG: Holliday junction resolvase RuvX [Candidatus Caenarcaniphilales bacterium]|nr:Holliday junction resolvase RuvX [Candidatus Caenarcaniphilales bacterium]